MSPGRPSTRSCSAKTWAKSRSLPIAVSSAGSAASASAGSARALLDDRVDELDGDVLRVAWRCRRCPCTKSRPPRVKRSASARAGASMRAASAREEALLRPRRSRAPCGGSPPSWRLRQAGSQPSASTAAMPPVGVVRGAGALGRHHRGAERVLRACTRVPNAGQSARLLQAAQDLAADAHAPTRGSRCRRPRRAARRRARGTRSAAGSPLFGMMPMPRHLRSHDLEDLDQISSRAAGLPVGARRRARTGSRPRPAPPRAAARRASTPSSRSTGSKPVITMGTR